MWVAENEATLLSTRPDALATSMTSTSRIVDALPLRDTTQIAPFGRIRAASSGRTASWAVESAPSRTTSVSGLGGPSVTSEVRSAIIGRIASSSMSMSATRIPGRIPSLSMSGEV